MYDRNHSVSLRMIMAMLIAHIYLLYTGFACGESTCFGDMPGVLAEIILDEDCSANGLAKVGSNWLRERLLEI